MNILKRYFALPLSLLIITSCKPVITNDISGKNISVNNTNGPLKINKDIPVSYYLQSINTLGNGLLLVKNSSGLSKNLKFIRIKNFLAEEDYEFKEDVKRSLNLKVDDKGNGFFLWSDSKPNAYLNKISDYKLDNKKINIGSSGIETAYKPVIEFDNYGNGFIIWSNSFRESEDKFLRPELLFLPLKNYQPLTESIKSIPSNYPVKVISKKENEYYLNDVVLNFSMYLPDKNYINSDSSDEKIISWKDYKNEKICIFAYIFDSNTSEEHISESKSIQIGYDYSMVARTSINKNGNGGIIDVTGFENYRSVFGPIQGSIFFTPVKDFKEDKDYTIDENKSYEVSYSPNINLDSQGNGYAIWMKNPGNYFKADVMIRRIKNFIPQ